MTLLSVFFGSSRFSLFFKQKTAYEMRIRDWSSDVCSSYLFAWKPLSENQSSHHQTKPFADRDSLRLGAGPGMADCIEDLIDQGFLAGAIGVRFGLDGQVGKQRQVDQNRIAPKIGRAHV